MWHREIFEPGTRHCKLQNRSALLGGLGLGFGFLQVAAEFEAHGGEKFVGEVSLAAGAEALVERGSENVGGDGFVDGGFDGPSAFAGIGDFALELRQIRIFDQRGGSEIQEPGRDDAAAAPDFGDVGQVEIVLIMFGVAEGRGFRINGVLLLADVGGTQNSQAFGVGGHDSVLDSIVDHFHKVAGAVRAAVQVSLLGGAADFVASGSSRDVADSRRQGSEDGIEVLDDVLFAANHHAITAFEAPDAAAGAYVNVMNFLRRELFGAADVVDVIRIAAVDQNVAGFEMGKEAVATVVHDGGGDH